MPCNATGAEPERLYNSIQSSPPGGAFASHSLIARELVGAVATATFAAPGVGVFSFQPCAVRPTE